MDSSPPDQTLETETLTLNVQDDIPSSLDLIPILITIALVILALIVFIKRRTSKPPMVKNKGNTIFIMGECGAGKTALLYKLASMTVPQTASSIEPTESSFEVELSESETKKISFIDIPGHNYTKMKYINELGSARAIVFIVDSANINSFGNAVDYLYNIMIQKEFQEKEIPLLLCANKQDLSKALSLKDFEHLIIREIEKVKKSRKAIQEEDNESTEDYLKHQDAQFTFAHSAPAITLCPASIVNGDVSKVIEFLRNVYA